MLQHRRALCRRASERMPPHERIDPLLTAVVPPHRVGGKPTEDWEASWRYKIDRWCKGLEESTFETFKNYPQDKAAVIKALRGLQRTLDRAQRVDIMNHMRTISEVRCCTCLPRVAV